MRRVFLAAIAVLLLHAAPSMAAQCSNLALVDNGGTAIASSERHSGFPMTQINNGNSSGNAWFDGTPGVWPDWAGVEWNSARTINRIIVKLATGYNDTQNWTYARSRVQFWDGSAWVDVTGKTGQDNPVLNWVMPSSRNGSEIKAWDMTTPISTTRIRFLFEDGALSGWAVLDEVEAYYGDGTCTKPGPEEPEDPEPARECVPAPAGTASASSTHSSGLYPVSGVNNGRRESGDSQGYWNDNTNGVWPDWVQVAWDRPQTIDRIVARIPLAREEFPLGEITLRRTRIQYFDNATSTWIDVVGTSSQPNPIIDWSGPREVYDGSESRSFDLATPVTTTKIRALIEEGSSDGWSWLDELWAYGGCPVDDPTPRGPNLALVENGGTAIASSERHSGFPITQLNNGSSTGNAWYDGTPGVWPDWAGIEWTSARTIDRIVVKLATGVYDTQNWTYARSRVQYWNGSAWIDVVGGAGQDNPVLNWAMPYTRDGSETKTWDLAAPVSTTRIRFLFEDGALSGYSVLDEIEAYRIA